VLLEEEEEEVDERVDGRPAAQRDGRRGAISSLGALGAGELVISGLVETPRCEFCMFNAAGIEGCRAPRDGALIWMGLKKSRADCKYEAGNCERKYYGWWD
jgi:hypothetical protein